MLTNAVWASGFVGAVSSLIVVSTEDFTVVYSTSSNPPTFPKLEGLIATVNFSAPSAKLSSSVNCKCWRSCSCFNYYTCYSCEVCSINCYTTICKAYC